MPNVQKDHSLILGEEGVVDVEDDVISQPLFGGCWFDVAQFFSTARSVQFAEQDGVQRTP
jgi:hypothetical protein